LEVETSNWFQKWTWKTVGWATLGFLVISAITGLFSYLVDVLLFENTLGYVYSFFAMIFYSLFLAFFYTWQKKNFIGIFSFGLCGLIGIPIEWWLEYTVSGALRSPWFAVAWGGIYILYGISADIVLIFYNPKKNEKFAMLLMSLIFSICFIGLSLLALNTFYNPPSDPSTARSLFDYWYFLFPYGIIQSIIGGYCGYYLGL
jgi:hypothetical protein